MDPIFTYLVCILIALAAGAVVAFPLGIQYRKKVAEAEFGTAEEEAKRIISDAIKDAGIAPEDIDYVNVHGTSTPAGDIPELKAVAGVLGDHVYDINISSTKSMTGHLLGAAGAVEALACIFALTHGVVPPTINCENLDPEIDSKLNLTLNTAQKRDVKCALSNTFGFGGHNSTVIFRKL